MTMPAQIVDHLGQTGQSLVRIVIASYFLGTSLGLFEGMSAYPLTRSILPEAAAEIAGRALIFLTACLVLVGLWLRASALVLAMLLFWSSHLSQIETGGIEAFWRDAAMVGALVLAFTRTLPRPGARRPALRFPRKVRRIKPVPRIVPRRVQAAARTRAAVYVLTEAERQENIFRDDLYQAAAE